MTSAQTSIKCIAFDLGGVLVDLDHGPIRALNHPRFEIENAFFGSERHRALSIGELGENAYFSQVASLLKEEASVIKKAWGKVVKWRPFALQLLRSQSLPFVIWSNTDPLHFEMLNKDLQLSTKDRQRSVLSYADGVLKPQANFFECGIAKLDLAPSEVLFLDDRLENIASAQTCGINAHRVSEEIELKRILMGALNNR